MDTEKVVGGPPERSNTAATIAGVLLVAVFGILGWLGLIDGSVPLKGRSGNVTMATGTAGIIAAYGFLFFAFLGTFVVLAARRIRPTFGRIALIAAIFFLPPLSVVF